MTNWLGYMFADITNTVRTILEIGYDSSDRVSTATCGEHRHQRTVTRHAQVDTAHEAWVRRPIRWTPRAPGTPCGLMFGYAIAMPPRN